MDFAQLCIATASEYEVLRRQISLCAAQGHSYEYQNCAMPAGCDPLRVALGFCLLEERWALYWRPVVAYHGENRVLKILFNRSQWRFDHFEDLTRFLRSLAPSMGMHVVPEVRPPEVRHAAEPSPAILTSAEDPIESWPALYLQLRQTLEERVLGQTAAVEAAAFRLYTHVGKQSPVRPLSLIFHGPTGVGKSELGKSIAPALERWSGHRWQFVWTELNTFTQPHSVHRLIGAPPGYVGYGDQPIFEIVRQVPHTIFMFDELEKAHPEVLKVFMSILDEGRCTAHRANADNGRELDFRRCVFIFTTNADLTARGRRQLGFSEERPHLERLVDSSKTAAGPAELAQRLFMENETARQAMVRQGVLPEIAGRFSGLIGFQHLDDAARQAITVKQIQSLGQEYGLRIAAVEPALAKALTPDQDALSMRSSTCVLEGLLAPLFSRAHRQTALRLTGTRTAPRLTPVHSLPTSVMFPSASRR